jgi:hypothetical protein
MPTKTEIKKALTSGTAHQRATIVGNHLATFLLSNENKELLTPEELEALNDSFKSPQDIRVYRKFAKLYELFKHGIMELNQHLVEFRGVGKAIHFAAFARQNLMQTEELLASIGFATQEICGPEKQVAIWEKVLKHDSGSFPMGTKPRIEFEEDEDQNKIAYFRFDGYELPSTREELVSVMNRTKAARGLSKEEGLSILDGGLFSYFFGALARTANTNRAMGKVLIEALSEVMKEYRFNIKPYKQFLKDAEETLRVNPPLNAMRGALQKPSEEDLLLLGDDTGKKIERMVEGNIERMKREEDVFFLSYDEIEIDQEYKKAVLEQFKHKDILDAR